MVFLLFLFVCFCIAHLLSNYKHNTHMYLNTFCVQCCYSTETTVCFKWKPSYNFRPSVCSFRKWGLIQWDTRLWLPLYVLVVGCLLSPWSPAIMLITPTSSPLLHSHPSFFFSSTASVGNEVSHPAEQLGVIQNWGLFSFAPSPAGPGQLICFRSQLCVQSTVCSQQGAWRPAFVSTILLWTLYVCAPAYTHYVLQQVAVTFVLGLVFLLRMRGVERRMNRNCCEKLI